MRLGILGGTFDPIHIGHLCVAEEMAEELDLDRVYLIPAAAPPHKERAPVTPFGQRLHMTRVAAQESPLLAALDLEGRRQGLSYSIETLRELHRILAGEPELFFLIGMDAFLEIKTWKAYQSLFDYAHFVVIQRPGFSSDALEPFIASLGVPFEREADGRGYRVVSSGMRLIYKEATVLGISSTQVRKRLAEGKSIRFLVTPAVRTYIAEEGLYGGHEDAR